MRFVIDVCAELVNKMRISQHYKIINVHIRIELSVICICLCGVKLPDDYVRKIETFRSARELHVQLYTCAFVGVNFYIFKCVSINFPTPALFSPVPRRIQSCNTRKIISVNTNVLGHDALYISTYIAKFRTNLLSPSLLHSAPLALP